MTPQKQKIVSDKEKGIYGNCLVTVLASMMDVPADECPQFQLMFDVKQPVEGYWDTIVSNWIQSMGYSRWFYDIDEDPYKIEGYEGYYIAEGMSPRGNHHVVIYKEGKMVHDPHPDNNGVIPTQYWVLKEIEGHWRHQNNQNE